VAYRWRVTQTEHAANEALLALRPAVSSSASSEAAATAAEYLKIARDYSGTDAAEPALVLGAGALFAEGKYSEAQTEFENFVRERPESSLAAIAAYGVAASLEAQGKNDQALTAYRDIPVRYPRSALIDESKLALARIYETKSQPDLALKTYEEIARPGTSGSASSQAMQRKQQLLAAHPELAKRMRCQP
jgi:TolA-binding protein